MQEPVLDFGEKLPPGINPGIQRALVHIERNFTDSVYLEDLAVLAGLSVCRFVTVFRRQVGLTPHRFICHRRIRHAKALLREGVPMAQAASEAGFFDQSHLSRHFKSICGVTPGRYLRDLTQPERPRAARGGYVQAVAV
jgi:AraC-like DNA-binding protein